MTRVERAALALIAGLSLAPFAGCSDEDGGFKQGEFPRIAVSPDPLILNVVPIGQSTSRLVTIRNAGSGKLAITSIQLSNSLDSREFATTHAELPAVLEADEELSVTLTYSPRDAGTDEGHLLIESNDREQPIVRVRVRTTEGRSELLVHPEQLAFGGVESGSSRTEAVTVTNVGTVPVDITGVSLTEDTSGDFAITALSHTGDASGDVAIPPGSDELPTIEQSEALVVSVTYTPTGRDTDSGTLVIETSDPVFARIPIPLGGAEPTPEIEVSPPAIVFGALDIGATADEPLFIRNAGTAPLVIDSIAFGVAPPAVNDQFTLEGLPEGFPDEPLVIEPDHDLSFTVRYAPREAGTHDTSIAIRTNDHDEAIVTVPVQARVRRPCIQVQPEVIEFGRVALGVESGRRTIRILNCGELPLDITEVRVDGAPGFHWGARGDDPRAAAIEPLAVAELEVWYQNDDLAEGEPAEAVLLIENDTPDRPVVEVPLTVVGGGAPTCELRLLPNRVDFGLVTRGRTRSRTVDVLNSGTGPCQVRDQRIVPLIEIPLPGFNNPKFILTGPLADLQVGPGEQSPVEITYRPDVFSADAARFVVTYFDPFRNEERTVEAQLVGISGESDIEVIPGRLDFGRVTAGDCASRTERVTVYNLGSADLCITDIRFDGEACDEFFVVERPVAEEDGCIYVTRNTPADVHLVYEPGDLGADECFLVFQSDDPDNPELRVPLMGEGVRDRRQVDTFEQASGQRVDVLFVVDNSGSMQDEQDNLADNFANFIRGADQFENDFQIGVVTTDLESNGHQGRLQGDPRIIRRGPDAEAQFQRNVRVGADGSGQEPGLEAAKRALSNPLAFDTGVACRADADCVEPDRCVEGVCGGYNRGFVREDAALVLVFVSDEEDQSPGTLDFYVDFFKNIKGFRNEAQFAAHAIVGAVNGQAAECATNNGNADAGRRYVEVANRTNGDVYSICDANFGDSLRRIGEDAFGLPVQFFLSRPAVAATVEVSVDGQARADGWVYDPPSNSVVFDADRVPQAGSTITVEYEAQCFPRHN